MGKKGSWFSAVRKALGSGNKKKDKKKHKSEKWSGNQQSGELDSSNAETALVSPAPPPPPPPAAVEQMKLIEAENEQNKHAYSVAIATAVAAEAAVAAAQAAAEVVRLTAAACNSGKSTEDIAAIRIQTAFRGYLARRALRALRGLVRLKTMIQGKSVKRQATSTLRCMQTLARVQSQVRARRIRMSEENQVLQRQIQQKHEKEQEKLKASSSGDDWNDSTRSKEQVDANLQMKQEAAMRRERALAYAYTHQPTRRNPSKSTNETFMDPNNPHWGWSWLERWMAARPWEDKCATDKEVNSDEIAAKSPASHPTAVAGITHLDNRPSPTARKQSRPPSRQSPSTPRSKAGRIRPASPRGSNVDDDSRSMASAQSERCRRHSFAGSSIRDDESLTSSQAVPSYMAATESARARSHLPSPLGFEKNGTPEKGSVSSAKKRLSFSASPGGAPRRHSGPPKVEI